MRQSLIEKLAVLKKFYQQSKRLLSYQELLSLWNFASKNAVYQIVQKLINEGFLTKDRVGKITPTNAFFSLNLYGEVPAGFPVPTPDENAELTSLEDYLIEKPNATFLLKVTGDSLKELGIMPGDLVLVEKTSEVKNGQVVLAQVDNEWTLKIFSKKRGKVILQAANKKYKPIKPKNNLSIYGVVKGVIRKYN